MVDDYESSDLAERHKIALRVADAMMSQPGSISPRLHSEVHEHFSNEEILELTVDVMKWNYQKVAVALGDRRRGDTRAVDGSALRQ